MSKGKKDNKKLPGRPKKPVEERLEQFSIRLPPRTKLGLDLISVDSMLSLSQTIEWLVTDAIRTHKLSNDQTTEEILKDIPGNISDRHFGFLLYKVNPLLLRLNERKVVQMVWKSKEMEEVDLIGDKQSRHLGEFKLIDWASDNWEVLNAIAREKADIKGVDLKKELDDYLSELDAMDTPSLTKKRAGDLF